MFNSFTGREMSGSSTIFSITWITTEWNACAFFQSISLLFFLASISLYSFHKLTLQSLWYQSSLQAMSPYDNRLRRRTLFSYNAMVFHLTVNALLWEFSTFVSEAWNVPASCRLVTMSFSPQIAQNKDPNSCLSYDERVTCFSECSASWFCFFFFFKIL